MKICVIGFGEVGRIYAEALCAAGETIGRICEQRLSPVGQELAEKLGAGVEAAPGGWLQEYDTVISAVTGSVALDVARTCAVHMHPNSLYVDLTTASPSDMQAAERHLRMKGIVFADVGILGAVSIKKGATALVASGGGAKAFAPIAEKLGAPLKLLEGDAGDAVRLKLLRSVFTKGLEALAVETLVAAEAQGLRQDFFDIVQDIDGTPLQQLLEVLVRTHVVHARRRHHEVEGAALQLKSLGMDPVVTAGVGDFFHRTSSRMSPVTSGNVPAIEGALEWLQTVCRKHPVEASAV